MKVVPFLANQLGEQLGLTQDNPTDSTGTFFNHVKNAVRYVETTQDDPNTPGNEKKAAVIEALKSLGIELAGVVGNVLLELAVLVIKTELGKIK